MGQSRTPTRESPSIYKAVGHEPGVEVVDGLADEQGPVPVFPPRQLDERGRLIPISEEERQARQAAAIRALNAIAALPEEDPPGSDEEFFRGIDENRLPGHKLFDGMY